MLHADPADTRIGGTTIRVSDFVDRSAVFDELYLHPPLLEACYRLIGQPFKLSTMHGRTLKPGAPAQRFHVDFAGIGETWPMAGFILKVDDFRSENGASCFVPGSQGEPSTPARARPRLPACGTAASMIVLNGSVWHGHGANGTALPRRSTQRACVRRGEKSGGHLPGRLRPERLNRTKPLARHLLAVEGHAVR
jgi:ectoine hydroxylase-related dioxygenase (phytanoyl-CoA dioxygenase family)